MLIKDKEILFGQYQFDAEEDDEIGFKVGEPIILIEKDEKYNDGWWKGIKLNGSVGIFPSNYVTEKNIKNLDIEKLLEYREQRINKKSQKLKSPRVKESNTEDLTNDDVLVKSPKQSSPKSPSKASNQKIYTTSKYDNGEKIPSSPKKVKSPKKAIAFSYDIDKNSNGPKSPKKLSSPKSPKKVVMSFYSEDGCPGSVTHSPNMNEQELSNVMPLPQKNNGDDSLTLKRQQIQQYQQDFTKDDNHRRKQSNVTINTNPNFINGGAPKSPYLSQSGSMKSPSVKYNSYTPRSASVKSPVAQKKSILKHKSTSLPASPIKKSNNVPMINIVNIKPNIATMEIENISSSISGNSSLYSPNRATRYMDDFMLYDNDPDNPKNWSVDEVSDWLYKIGYISASKFFKEKKVDGQMLMQMNLPTLREIGVSTLSERITLLHSILSLKEEYSSKCFEEIMYNGSVTSDSLASPTKQTTLDGNSYQMEMNSIYEKALKNPNIDDEKKKKIKKMMSTFTVSDYLIDSPENKEYPPFQNQLVKNQQIQNRQYGRDQLTLSQFNNIYHVAPQQYTISDQYRRNVSIINSHSDQKINPKDPTRVNKESLMISAKKLVKGRKNNVNNCRVSPNGNQKMNNNNSNSNNNSNNINESNVEQKETNQNYYNVMPTNNQQLAFSEQNQGYGYEHISPKVKDKKHKYLNQYHDFNLATRQGWLNVKYGTFKIWKKRWAILVYDTLYLLKDQYINNEKPPRIVLVLQITQNDQIDKDKQDSKKFNFKIKDPKLGNIHFATDSQLSMITWVNLFVRIITSNPIKQIQLYPLRDQNVTSTFMMNSNVNNVAIGNHFQINRKEKYQVQKQSKPQEEEEEEEIINNNDYDMETLMEVNAAQKQFNDLTIRSMSTVGNNSNYSSPTSNDFNTILSPSRQQTQMVQQQLQQQYQQILQQQQLLQKQQQQILQQQRQLQMKNRNKDLTINTSFNPDGTLTRGKSSAVYDNNGNSNNGNSNNGNSNNGLTLDTDISSGDQILLSVSDTTSARKTLYNNNRNNMFVSPGYGRYLNNNINASANQTNYVNYNSRKSLYTPVSDVSEVKSFYDSPYGGQESNYKYSNDQSQSQRLSDLNFDPYAEIRKYNYSPSIPKSDLSAGENFVNSYDSHNYIPSMQPPPKINTYVQ